MPRMTQLQAIAHRVMLERGLLPDFSPAALAEVRSIHAAPGADGRSVRDLRSLLWASIDNDSSRDLDQLSVAEPLSGSDVKILVAVADVDELVRRGSPIDDHAATNTTSVYTAAKVFPMLPEQLSTDLTSLGEDQDRLAIVTELRVDGGGNVTRSDVYRAIVRNRAKLAYDATAAWLDGSAPPPDRVAAVPGLDEQLRIQDRVAQSMRAVRFRHGALSLETPRAEPVFDGAELADMVPQMGNRAKQLIEDFMIAANGATAQYLSAHGSPSLRRVLRSPERWGRIVELATSLGEALPAAPDGEALARFLDRRRAADPAGFPDTSLSVVKLLGRGEYELSLPGKPTTHFGLAVTNYTHSTAPNRRFPDLLTQRLLKAVMAGNRAPYDNEELAALARHATDQETNAAKVERQVGKSASAMLLSTRVGQTFDGIVTGASDKGTWVRISHPAAEGKLVEGFEGLDVGDTAHVELAHTNIEKGFIDFVRRGPRRAAVG